MSCTDTRAALAAFDVHGGDDLADDVALHLDRCRDCRAAYDARFVPWVEASPQAARRGSRRWWVGAAAAAVGLVAVAFAAERLWFATPAGPALDLVEQAPPAGDLAGTTWLVGSGSVAFGDVTVVVFWEAWCPHCPDGLLHVQDLADALGPDGLDVVGVTTLSKGVDEARARKLVEELGLTFPQAADRQRVVADRFGVEAWPRAYVVRDGRIVWEGHPSHLDEASLGALLR